MLSNDFLLKDTQELEVEIERHCAGLGLDCSKEYDVRQFVHELLQNIEELKKAGSDGDRTARAKVELFGMTMLMHEANIKAYGADYVTNINALAKRESAWVAIARAIWSELDRRKAEQ